MTITTQQRLDPITAVRGMAETLIAEHLDGWRFEFDRAVKRAGAAHFRTRTITVSQHLAVLWGLEEMRETVLHEIAHAAVGAGHGHDHIWRAKAIELGATGRRTHSGPVASERMAWRGECPNGHETFRVRRPQVGRQHSCGRCSRRFDRRFLVTWSPNRPTDEVVAA